MEELEGTTEAERARKQAASEAAAESCEASQDLPFADPEPPQSAPPQGSDDGPSEGAAELSQPDDPEAAPTPEDDAALKAVMEAVIYITDEPLEARQIAAALGQPIERVKTLLDELVSDYTRPERGLTVRELAGGYKMSTKPEHHEAVRAFVKNLKPPFKLSLAALETLAVIAYKQPITAPEIMEIRGVQGAGVLKTLVDRKLIATSGRKNVVGKPILYKTTKEFLIQFGLKDVSELPTLKEFEELGRLALSDGEPEPGPPQPETGETAVATAEAAPAQPEGPRDRDAGGPDETGNG
ncbi:MAG: SMC-Scp complex subunit ScpB [Bryobacteraceae bacterium]